ncbi:MAG: MFS transporter [Thermoanaerobaculum sp.]|nr:MFS transporter [Thermoanaerobaculum sp.]
MQGTASLREQKALRWTAMALVSTGMLCGYYVADVASPLKPLLEGQLGWSSTEYGFFTGAYGWFNVFLGMLVVGGIVLDRLGPRLTGVLAISFMFLGTATQWWALSTPSLTGTQWFGVKGQVLVAALGFALFGVGIEWFGITATKIIVRWFKGHEMALAMGLQVALGRLGTALALGSGAAIAVALSVAGPFLVGSVALACGLVAFLFFASLDRRLDASEGTSRGGVKPEDQFRFADIGAILADPGFWLLTGLCALFYSAVFPFLKYAPDLMVQKFGIEQRLSGLIPSLLPFGTILLTPVFGNLYDRKGKGATIMLLGALFIAGSHILLALPWLPYWPVAVVAVLLLGVGFSLVPSAMWPSVPKIVEERRLGTAYALIFFIQNLVALMGVPYLIGWVLDRYCLRGKEVVVQEIAGKLQEVTKVQYDYTLPMVLFVLFGLLAVGFALGLRAADRRRRYGLQLPAGVVK